MLGLLRTQNKRILPPGYKYVDNVVAYLYPISSSHAKGRKEDHFEHND